MSQEDRAGHCPECLKVFRMKWKNENFPLLKQKTEGNFVTTEGNFWQVNLPLNKVKTNKK